MRGVGAVPTLESWLQGLMAFVGMCVAGFPRLLGEGMLFCAKLRREICRITDTMFSHQLLLFGRTGLAGRQRLIEDWRSGRGNRSPLMKLLAEEIRFV